MDIKLGDEMTIAGFYRLVPNPHRRWWQLWKPRMVRLSELARFKVTDVL